MKQVVCDKCGKIAVMLKDEPYPRDYFVHIIGTQSSFCSEEYDLCKSCADIFENVFLMER